MAHRQQHLFDLRPPPQADHLLPQNLHTKIERVETAIAVIRQSLTALTTSVREIDTKFTGLANHYGTFTTSMISRVGALESRHGGRRGKTRKAKNKSTE